MRTLVIAGALALADEQAKPTPEMIVPIDTKAEGVEVVESDVVDLLKPNAEKVEPLATLSIDKIMRDFDNMISPGSRGSDGKGPFSQFYDTSKGPLTRLFDNFDNSFRLFSDKPTKQTSHSGFFSGTPIDNFSLDDTSKAPNNLSVEMKPLKVSVVSYDTGKGMNSWNDLLNEASKMAADLTSLFNSDPVSDSIMPDTYLISGVDLNGDYRSSSSDLGSLMSFLPSFPSLSRFSTGRPGGYYSPSRTQAGEMMKAQQMAQDYAAGKESSGLPVAAIVALIMSGVLLAGLIAWLIIRRLRAPKGEMEFHRVGTPMTTSSADCDFVALHSRRPSEASILA